MVSGFDPQGARDVVFIPVGLNYDRVLEDRVLTAAAATPEGQAPRFAFNPFVLAGFLAKSAWRGLRGQWYRNGYACVSFGTPVSLRSWLSRRGVDLRTLRPEARTAEIDLLGRKLLEEVGAVIPALPVSLVARALAEAQGAPLTAFELKGRVFDLMTALEQAGHYVHVPRQDRDYAIDVGLRMLTMRRIIAVDDTGYRAVPAEAALLAYYANAIGHLLPPLARSSPEQEGRIPTGPPTSDRLMA